MNQTSQASSQLGFIPPSSMDGAKAQLQEIKLKKQDLSLQKKQVMEQQRQRRAEYTERERSRATWGKGTGAAISKDFGKAARKSANVVDSYGRKSLAADLEPLEEQRQAIEAQIATLDRQKLELDRWIAERKNEEAAKKAAKKADKDAAAPRTARDTATASSEDHIAQLKELAGLKEAGVLTEEEFQAEKKRILGS